MAKNNTPFETQLLIGLLNKYDISFTPVSVPEETKIFNNFSDASWTIFGSIAGIFFCFMMYLATKSDAGKFFCIAIVIGCAYYLINSIFINKDKSAQLTVNRRGFSVKGSEFILWNQVKDERIEYRRTGRHGLRRVYYLHIELIEEISDNIVIPIENLNITTQELYNIIKTYHQESANTPQPKPVKSRSTEL